MSLNKSELIAKVASKTGSSRANAGDFVNAVFETIVESVKSGHEVDINAFGTFSAKHVDAREVRNPSTGEKIQKPAGRKFTFKPKPSLKDLA